MFYFLCVKILCFFHNKSDEMRRQRSPRPRHAHRIRRAKAVQRIPGLGWNFPASDVLSTIFFSNKNIIFPSKI